MGLIFEMSAQKLEWQQFGQSVIMWSMKILWRWVPCLGSKFSVYWWWRRVYLSLSLYGDNKFISYFGSRLLGNWTRQRNLNPVHTTVLILVKTRIYCKILAEPWISRQCILSWKYLRQVTQFVGLSVMFPLGCSGLCFPNSKFGRRVTLSNGSNRCSNELYYHCPHPNQPKPLFFSGL